MVIDRPNQVWAMDTTYIPMARGFVYLAAVVDWFSRRVLAWKLSITLKVEFCIEAVEEALFPLRPARDFQHRPEQPIHQRGLHRPAAEKRHHDQHGWQGGLARQGICQTALALAEV